MFTLIKYGIAAFLIMAGVNWLIDQGILNQQEVDNAKNAIRKEVVNVAKPLVNQAAQKVEEATR